MTTELIQILRDKIGAEEVNSVNARDLHAALEIKKDFSTWIKYQLKAGKFVQDTDFIVFGILPKKGEKPGRGQPPIDYHLTIRAAKHIGMRAGTDRGIVIRDYFVGMEAKALAGLDNPSLVNPVNQALVTLLTQVDKLQQAQATHQQQLARQAEQFDLLGQRTYNDVQEVFDTLKAQRTEINELHTKVAILSATQPQRSPELPDGYYTIQGYASMRRVVLTPIKARSLGHRAAHFCRQRGEKIERPQDPRWGAVGAYPAKVLDLLFSGLKPQTAPSPKPSKSEFIWPVSLSKRNYPDIATMPSNQKIYVGKRVVDVLKYYGVVISLNASGEALASGLPVQVSELHRFVIYFSPTVVAVLNEARAEEWLKNHKPN